MTHDSRLDPIGPSPEQRMEAVRAAAEAQAARLKEDWKMPPAEPLPAPERTEEQAVVEAAREVVAAQDAWLATNGDVSDEEWDAARQRAGLSIEALRVALARSTPAPSDGGEA